MNLYEAKENLYDLVERAANGEDIVIARSGRPRVRLVPVAERTEPRRPGALKGQIWISPDFDDDISYLFECLQDDEPEPPAT